MATKKITKLSNDKITSLPVLPLRDVVVYPYMVIPLFVGRDKSVNALEIAMREEQKIFLISQKNSQDETADEKNLYKIGTIATILQLLRLPDGTLKVLVEGSTRAKILKFTSSTSSFLSAKLEVLDDINLRASEVEPMSRSLISQFDQYVKLNKKIPPEVTSSLSGIDDPSRLADTVAAHMTMKVDDRQQVLKLLEVKKRIELLMMMMETEIDMLQIEKRIRGRVKRQMEKNQREYYLNEQIKAIQKELGDINESYDEIASLEKKIKAAKMPEEAYNKTVSELKKLKNMAPMSAEATVSRNYIDTMVEVPWSKRTKIKHDLPKAQKILDVDHHGLKKIKERILEYIAVQQRVEKLNGPILCLVGPPGVGKTSLGASIARATGRKFTRIALGGVRDEAEIRGHRRTYIGSMPGRIIQRLAKVEVRNPLFMLDEIDKMSMDFRGDPSSALLEVLDPEQNFSFSDHYLEVDYDLSQVMFVATANSLDIPGPLLDRMEIIRLPGYTEDEKKNIAKKYLIPKHIKGSGLKKAEIKLNDQVILDAIRYYTREAGVRNLEREIAKICRKVVKQILLDDKAKKMTITSENIEELLGVKKFRYGLAHTENYVGQVTGLAWTEVGGELLKVEATVLPGKGKTLSTGKLGDVMQESIQAAITVVRSRAQAYGIDADFYAKHDLHIHVPDGATPKDGPSAGVAMCTALVSALSSIPVRADLAMTGEITLRGEVLPIGGLKEKLLAALRGGIKVVLIPEENTKDLKEIPDNVKKGLKVIPVRWIDQVLDEALAAKVAPTKSLKASHLPRGSKKAQNTQPRHH